MADIFISYAKQERELTVDLAHDLEAKGCSVWWDTSLLSGDLFEEVILAELAQARAVIVIWTKSSVKSLWVKSEARRAAAPRKSRAAPAAGKEPRQAPPSQLSAADFSA
jgi:hypothetical protein